MAAPSTNQHLDDEEDEETPVPDSVLHSALELYDKKGSGSDIDQAKVRQSLAEAFQRQSCLICLEIIRNSEATWSCEGCFNPYHLVCIQRWVKDGVHQHSLQAVILSETTPAEAAAAGRQAPTTNGFGLKLPESSLEWGCPKCRKSYKQSQCPTKYLCFCRKVVNPKPDPWIAPHSCGNVCGHRLSCEHSCLLLCHPGSHPACPVTVHASCYCGRQPAQPRRCGTRGWSCQKPCNKPLACEFHLCPLNCHEGDCPPCTEESKQKCLCGAQAKMRPCADLKWQCDRICGKLLGCGNHTCQNSCHAGHCEPCVTEGVSTCPCGKTKLSGGDVVCQDDVNCCGDTCGQLLECRIHQCFNRCHKDSCPPCNQMITKRCRCMLKEKSVVCGTEFLCDLKCKRKRDCGRHPCSRRCCDGHCPPCEQVCGRTLKCGQHKCTSPCHSGLCYPCPLMSVVTCRCGETQIRVPCGREKKTRPPRCRQPCLIPPDCHHAARNPHPCHFDRCPPCNFVCDKKHEACMHVCHARCHSAVLMNTNIPQNKPSAPWEKFEPKLELVNLPCPPCMDPVPVTCIGAHETIPVPCSQLRSYSCGRPCGHKLACGNHTCQKPCHAPDVDCDECAEGCSLPRPPGCGHKCLRPCHPAPCDPCKQMTRKTCHCTLVQKYVPCAEWSVANDDAKIALLSCENRCPKLLTCGHRCTKNCHPGECSPPEECRKKVSVHCPCKCRKDVMQCNKVQLMGGNADKKDVLKCDVTCSDAATKRQMEEEMRLEEIRRTEEAKRAKEREELERKAAGKSAKRRRAASSESDTKNFWTKWNVYITSGISVTVVIAAAIYLTVYSY